MIKRDSGCKVDDSNLFAIVIDEFFQMPERCLLDLCVLLEDNPDIIVVPIGDHRQMPGIENPKYAWLHCDIMNSFVNYKVRKNYIPGSCRFSKEVRYMIELLEQCRFREFFDILKTKNPDGSYKFECNDIKSRKYHICHYRKKKYQYCVSKVNNVVCPKLCVNNVVICDKKYETNQVDSNDNVITETKDDKETACKLQILVGEKYTILGIRDRLGGKECKLAINVYGDIKYGWFPMNYKSKRTGLIEAILSPGNASTTFREQGREITEPYIIHDAHCMTKQELIVAISRGKSTDNNTPYLFSLVI